MKKFEFTFQALWTICMIVLIWKEKTWVNTLINQCYKKITTFQNEFSRFQKDSSLSLLNHHKQAEVSDEFLSLIQKSREIFHLTQWYFNPLIDVRNIGYSHSFNEQIFEKKDFWENLHFENIKNYGNLIKLEPDMNLDFGSIAKWYFSQKISLFLQEKWWKNNFVNLWGDIYVSGVNLEGEKWKVAIESPFWETSPITTLSLTNMSISTSGSYLRKWEIEWKKYHHLRNPFSSEWEKELISVSIIHPSWYMTDALATACFAMWKQRAIDFCEKNNISYLFILENGEVIQNLP